MLGQLGIAAQAGAGAVEVDLPGPVEAGEVVAAQPLEARRRRRRARDSSSSSSGRFGELAAAQERGVAADRAAVEHELRRATAEGSVALDAEGRAE